MRLWLREQKRLLRVWIALNNKNKYPETLPNPVLKSIDQKSLAVIEGLNSVCLFLGPYRNLTTLTASFLFLHPEIQVFDHGSPRIFAKENLNFFSTYSEERFNNFAHYLITMSQGGSRGKYGGSMIVSHAFADNEDLRHLYFKRYGSRLRKRSIKSLVWKEPQRLTQKLRNEEIDLIELIKENNKLRFFLPIRNPLDCAQSITRMGGTRWYGDVIRGDIKKALDLILSDFKWFFDQREKSKEQFFHFYQNQLSENTLIDIADFLGVARDKRWIQDCLEVYKIRARYQHEEKLLTHYKRRVAELFSEHEELKEGLLNFAKQKRNLAMWKTNDGSEKE